jgi:aspartate aminotransferase
MLENRFAERLGRLKGESAFEVLARAKKLEAEGRHIVHFEIGEPDFNTPPNIIDAAKKALDSGFTHYTPSQGYLPLREAIADYTKRWKNVNTNPDEIIVVPGGKPIIFYTLLALIDHGDEVIYPDPGFPAYSSVISFAGGVGVPITIREERDFTFDVNELISKITPKTKLIILNSPANPTGGVLSPQDTEDIAAALKGRGIYVLSDEIYSRTVYEGSVKSIASIPEMKDWTIILDGFSKAYAMTGWRLGYGIANKELTAQINSLMVNSNSCVPAFTQIAGVEALTGPQDAVDAMNAEFRKRRDLIIEGLNNIRGLSCKTPKGAFYAFPNIRGTGMSSKEAADFLLGSAGVATLSGTSFGAAGEGYLRLSYANSVKNIEIALDRIEKAFKNR